MLEHLVEQPLLQFFGRVSRRPAVQSRKSTSGVPPRSSEVVQVFVVVFVHHAQALAVFHAPIQECTRVSPARTRAVQPAQRVGPVVSRGVLLHEFFWHLAHVQDLAGLVFEVELDQATNYYGLITLPSRTQSRCGKFFYSAITEHTMEQCATMHTETVSPSSSSLMSTIWPGVCVTTVAPLALHAWFLSRSAAVHPAAVHASPLLE